MDDPVAEFRNWYFSKPFFTRTYMAASVVFALLTMLEIVSPYSLYYTFD